MYGLPLLLGPVRGERFSRRPGVEFSTYLRTLCTPHVALPRDALKSPPCQLQIRHAIAAAERLSMRRQHRGHRAPSEPRGTRHPWSMRYAVPLAHGRHLASTLRSPWPRHHAGGQEGVSRGTRVGKDRSQAPSVSTHEQQSCLQTRAGGARPQRAHCRPFVSRGTFIAAMWSGSSPGRAPTQRPHHADAGSRRPSHARVPLLSSMIILRRSSIRFTGNTGRPNDQPCPTTPGGGHSGRTALTRRHR